MRRLLAWSLAVCLVAVAGCGSGGDATADDKGRTSSTRSSDDGPVAEAVSIDAAVDVSLADADFVAVGDPVPVAVGDVVRTDDSGFAEVTYHDGSLTRLDLNTELVVVALSDDEGGSSVRTEMGVGRTWNRVKELAKDDEFEVKTSVATATVRGTAFFIECPDDETCTFTVLEGTVVVELPDGSTVELVAPSQVTVTADGVEGEPAPVDPGNVLARDDWLSRNTELDVDAGYPEAEEFAGAPDDELTPVGTWEKAGGGLVVEITGGDGTYELRILDQPAACSDEWQALDPAATFGGDASPYSGTETLLLPPGCVDSSESPITMFQPEPDILQYKGFSGEFLLERQG